MRCSLEVWPTYSTDIIREVNARLQVLEQTDTTSTHCTSRLSRSISEDHVIVFIRMTISYQLDLSSASTFPFLRLLFRWRASVWKLVLKELIIWTILYLSVSFFYRTSYFMTPEQKVTFEKIAHYFHNLLDYIPFTFILGFFVDIIMSRWSDLFDNMGYVESQSIFIANYVRGSDKETRLLRRAMARYLCLTQALVFRDISVSVRKRFPTMNSLVQAGLLLEEEKEKLESIKLKYDKYWVPTNWIYTLIFRARKEGKITHDILASKLCDEIKSFRYNLQMVCNYDWVPLPLVYLQAVFLATYAYFATCLIGRQKIITDRDTPYKHTIFTAGGLSQLTGGRPMRLAVGRLHTVDVSDSPCASLAQLDMILPVMTMIQFFFVIGWVKVAQGLLNPFGQDDDDFECNYLIDKNLATSLCIVDDEYDNVPEIKVDRFWHRSNVQPLYSTISASIPDYPLVGSAINARLNINEKSNEMVVRMLRRRNGISMGRKSRTSSIGSVCLATLTRKRSSSFGNNSSMTVSEQDRREIDARLLQFTVEDASCNATSTNRRVKFQTRTVSDGRENDSHNTNGKHSVRSKSLSPSMKLFAVEKEKGEGELNEQQSSSESSFVPPDPYPSSGDAQHLDNVGTKENSKNDSHNTNGKHSVRSKSLSPSMKLFAVEKEKGEGELNEQQSSSESSFVPPDPYPSSGDAQHLDNNGQKHADDE
ncbi:Bestrophin-1 [Toxocara canis]|uniref:Bestrophin homolog n=1 Tax=Toxocara canis TaxID=6265 RepID=A0A0B2VBF0_TOXCA|nr:Bestrophin-1 [Toxocara canis]